MTATDELRRLLDERGVEWDYGIRGATTTRFSANGVDLTFTPMRDGLVCSTILTPEQAIAATLGSCNCSDNCTNGERTNGTCHPVISDNLTESEGTGDAWADCSECGHLLFVLTDPNSQVPNFCPNCGAKVVEPTTNDVDAEVDA